MYLNIILAVFVVVQIVTLILIYKWWKKYGKALYKSFINIKGMPSTRFSPSQIPDMSQMMKQLELMSKNIGKFK